MASSLLAEGTRCCFSLPQAHGAKDKQLAQSLRPQLNQISYQRPSRQLKGGKCSVQAVHDAETSVSRSVPPSRREVLQALASLAVAGATGACCQPAAAGEGGSTQFLPYMDSDGKFGLSIPADWAQGEGKASSQRRVVAFFKEGDTDTNVNVVITPLSADYTKMGSFGTAEAFGETLVNGLDRSWAKPKGPEAKLLDAKTKNGRYFVEYTFQAPGQMKRHLMSSIGMGFDGTYNRLYTVTAQAREEEFAQYAGVLNKVLSSFELKFKSPVY
ncbi:PsbP domain-containing protein 3 [Klebsormidium nitens]|uniref:PsbP domain-containing protein 3 n=1 Tax=Klebsormidium nitens TaxID=105231 RepID=A0A1Y1ICX3_KLENI|nr:PsbP domain-containing protein 3 [Klebsormidium nitens]|eukprot:GAQ88443.1 PsbP domain-containing protein 3 [Klebsormidium nitens]